MGSQQQFCLRWNNHQSNLLSVFDNLLQNETLVDVTLACEGLSLKAHKVVLSACSPYFQHLFTDNPCKHPIVILKDIGYTDMKTLIDFMYKGEVNVSHDQLSTLLRVADTLKVKGLAEVTESMAARESDQVSSRRQSESSVPETSHKQSFIRSASTAGSTSPPPKRRKKRRISGGSTGHSDDVDSRGAKEASSRSSTPVEIPVVPKSEVVDISYEDTDKPPCSVAEEALPLMNASSSSQHVSLSLETSIMPHPLSNTDSADLSQKFDSPEDELEDDMPFTQHLSVCSDGAPSSPGAHPSTSSSSLVDQSAYFPPSSSSVSNVASASCPSTSRSANTQDLRRSLRMAPSGRSAAKVGDALF